MSHGKLREEKTCQNCGDEVSVRFCPSCGQENIETKKSFHYLFTHFIEDLVHYDNGFWKAIKYLLVAPYMLTVEYLNGKRKKYVTPVKLFIFMNFLTFFLTGILSYESEDIVKVKKDSNPKIENKIEIGKPKGTELNFFTKKMNQLSEKYPPEVIFDKAGENIKHYFPKVLFAYLPIFAFYLWLFHNKKRWWYFDNGIFTFHFFSSIMLLISIHAILDFIFFKMGWTSVQTLLNIILFLYIIYLFYKSHKQMYLEDKLKSFAKATSILLVNFITMAIVAFILLVMSIMYIK